MTGLDFTHAVAFIVGVLLIARALVGFVVEWQRMEAR